MTISSSYPYNLQNGTTADATQVMADFLQIQNDVNSNAAHNGANSDITSLTGLSTPLGLAYGGTGSATAAAARSVLGIGTAGVENLATVIIDDGSGNLTIGSAVITAAMITAATITGTQIASGVALARGAPTTTTAAADDNTTKIATTAYVIGQAASKATTQTGTSLVEFVTPGNAQNHPSAAKAWVDFTVSGGVVTIQKQYNVASMSRIARGLHGQLHYGFCRYALCFCGYWWDKRGGVGVRHRFPSPNAQ